MERHRDTPNAISSPSPPRRRLRRRTGRRLQPNGAGRRTAQDATALPGTDARLSRLAQSDSDWQSARSVRGRTEFRLAPPRRGRSACVGCGLRSEATRPLRSAGGTIGWLEFGSGGAIQSSAAMTTSGSTPSARSILAAASGSARAVSANVRSTGSSAASFAAC